MIEEHVIAITTTGGAGVSTGNGTPPSTMNGLLVGIYITASVAVAATADWAFTDAVSGIAILTLTDSTATGFIAPGLPVVGLTGTAITNSHRALPIVNAIKCTIAQADDGVYTIRYYIDKSRRA
jgi:hypothetical protein